MKQIIEPIKRELIEQELTSERFIRRTNNADNELYCFNGTDAPNLMREVGRLREWSFRTAGGGTGAEVDIDELDLRPDGYKQLIVWDPAAREILGGYRYIHIDPSQNSLDNLSTSHYFTFSERFVSDYVPQMIELGRSFVQPKYQMTGRAGKGLYALDNLWDGLGALIVLNPNIRYFFGKVTMYNSYNVHARNLLFYFFEKYFADKEALVTPQHPVQVNIDREQMAQIFTGATYKDDYRILGQKIREYGERIPPLINSYMNLSPSMKVFGTCINSDFGQVEETGILITIPDIYQEKIERHIKPFGLINRLRQAKRLVKTKKSAAKTTDKPTKPRKLRRAKTKGDANS